MIGAIVLAAGRSQRMGKQKLLLPWGDTTVIAQVVVELLEGFALANEETLSTVVVTGPDAEAIRAELSNRPVTFVTNSATESEMLESVRCGLRALPSSCEGILIVPGDQPTISAEVVSEVIRAFRASAFNIVIPTFEGQRGHPMLFAARFRDEVLTSLDHIGLNGLRQRHLAEVFELPVATGEILEDLDTPADYERLHAQKFSPTSG